MLISIRITQCSVETSFSDLSRFSGLGVLSIYILYDLAWKTLNLCFSRICECKDERAVSVKVERKASGKKGYWRQVWPIWPIRRPRTKNCSSKTSETWHRLNWDEYRPPPLDTRRWHLKHHMFSFFSFHFSLFVSRHRPNWKRVPTTVGYQTLVFPVLPTCAPKPV